MVEKTVVLKVEKMAVLTVVKKVVKKAELSVD